MGSALASLVAFVGLMAAAPDSARAQCQMRTAIPPLYDMSTVYTMEERVVNRDRVWRATPVVSGTPSDAAGDWSQVTGGMTPVAYDGTAAPYTAGMRVISDNQVWEVMAGATSMGVPGMSGSTGWMLVAGRFNADRATPYTDGNMVFHNNIIWEALAVVNDEPGAAGSVDWTEVPADVYLAPLRTATSIATHVVVCDSASDGDTITETNNNTIILKTGDVASHSIRVTGAGGDVRVTGGSISKPNDGDNGAALSVINPDGSAAAINLMVGAGRAVANLDTDTAQHAIHADGQDGTVTMMIGGSTTTMGEGSHAVYGSSDAAMVDIDIMGGVHATSGDRSDAIRGVVGGAMDLNIDIESNVRIRTGGATSHGVHAQSTGAGDIEVNIMAGSSVTVTGMDSYAVRLQGGSASDMTLNIGTTASLIAMDAAMGLIEFVGGQTNMLNNDGRLTGRIVMGDGDDTVMNSEGAEMVFTSSPTFGTGTDSLTNDGTLQIRQLFNDENMPISMTMTGLETFNQGTTGVLRFTFDPNNLPANGAALLVFDAGATGTLQGDVEFNYGNAQLGGVYVVPLIRVGTLNMERLTLPEGIGREEQNGVLMATLVFFASSGLPYEALLQSVWFADNAFSRSLSLEKCTEQDLRSENSRVAVKKIDSNRCVWGHLGGRYLDSDPSNSLGYEEISYSASAAMRQKIDDWEIIGGVGYEYMDMELQRAATGKAGESDGSRFMASLAVRRDFEQDFGLEVAVRGGFGDFSYKGTSLAGNRVESSPDIYYVAGHLAAETVIERNLFESDVTLETRASLSFLGAFMDGFMESNSLGSGTTARFRDLEELYVSLEPSLKIHYESKREEGYFNGSYSIIFGGSFLLTDPRVDVKADILGETYSTKGRMRRNYANLEGVLNLFKMSGLDIEASYGFNASLSSSATLSHKAMIRAKMAF